MNDIEIRETIARLRETGTELPPWEGGLKNEYYPRLHPVMDRAAYRDKVGTGGVVRVTRATRGLQRRAVKIMAGMMFGIPVERTYAAEGEAQKRAAKILEEIMQANRVDALNIERAVRLFASCQAATLWYAVREENNLYGEPCPLKLRCRTFSPMGGEEIFPLMDERGDMEALSFGYRRREGGRDTEYFDSYTAAEHRKWRRPAGGQWEAVERESIAAIGKIPAAYICRESPVWEDSNNVTEIEWAYSRNGNYLRRNSVPVYEVCDDGEVDFGRERDDDERLVLHLSAAGRSGYKTWDQAVESLRFHTEGLERGFFSDIQLPNFSFDEMKSAPASGESKRYMFMDAHIKVLEEQGAWLSFFGREMNVVKAFAKVMFPSLAGAFDALRVRSRITPFSMTDEKDTIANGAASTGGKAIASRRTAVARLGWAEDVEAELAEIGRDEARDAAEGSY